MSVHPGWNADDTIYWYRITEEHGESYRLIIEGWGDYSVWHVVRLHNGNEYPVAAGFALTWAQAEALCTQAMKVDATLGKDSEL